MTRPGHTVLPRVLLAGVVSGLGLDLPQDWPGWWSRWAHSSAWWLGTVTGAPTPSCPVPTKELPEPHDLVSEVPTRPFPHMVSVEHEGVQRPQPQYSLCGQWQVSSKLLWGWRVHFRETDIEQEDTTGAQCRLRLPSYCATASCPHWGSRKSLGTGQLLSAQGK